MRALVWDGTAAKVVERDPPPLAAGWATIAVSLAGVCNTDLEITRGYMDFRGVLGHELVGVVSDGPAEWRGRRVVSEINFACGHCESCNRDLGRHCPTRTVMGIVAADGAFAELLTVPVRTLHAVPDRVPDEQAVFAEPLAAAFEVLDQVQIEPGARALVLGDGKLGLLVAQVLQQAGARVLCVGRHRDKLAVLAARGIETCVVDEFRDERAPLVVEATGTAGGLAAAIRCTSPRGTLVLKSTVAGAVSVDLAPLVVNEISVIGSRCGRFAPALQALEAGRIDVASLITERVPFARAADALEIAARSGVLKVLIEM